MNFENIIYKVKDRKIKYNLFLGAGASVSSNMPLASRVVDDILSKHKDNPNVKKLTNPSYVEAVNALDADDRKELFENYIKNTHISISYLYLAELYKAGYIKYIFTTNFDDLILRALALKGIFPPIYDMTTIEELSSANPSDGAVIFLHGRYNGEWQLNTQSEMQKVVDLTKKLFTKIDDNRWLIIGYSGDDLVFDSLTAYCSRFNAHLYWIGYKDNEPSERLVGSRMFGDTNRQAYYIKGYDSDSFFKELYIQLEGKTVPEILSKPFTTMSNVYNGVVEIDEQSYPNESLFLGMAKSQISSMTTRFEGRIDHQYLENEDAYLRNELFDLIKKREFNNNRIIELEKTINNNNNIVLLHCLGLFYTEYGIFLFDSAIKNNSNQGFYDALEKFEKADIYLITSKPNLKAPLYSSWHNCLFELGLIENNQEKLRKAEEIFSKIENKNYAPIYFNRGNALHRLSNNTDISLLESAIKNYEEAIAVNDSYYQAWENCALCYNLLGKLKNEKTYLVKSHDMLKEAFKRGFISLNLIQSCILQENHDEAIDYLETFAEKDEYFIKNFLSQIILKSPFDKLNDDQRIKELKKKYI
ncbi:hypothetical protein CMU93_08035 [Elizabethkingia anophelis]|nr:hypothetical protein [Elizabethkingia anophelis]